MDTKDTVTKEGSQDSNKSDDKAGHQGTAPKPSDEDIEACMKASEEELRNVTSTIQRSFTQTGSVSPAPSPRLYGYPGGASSRGAPAEQSMSSTASRSSVGVLDQLMAEMDQVFTSVLETGQDELRAAQRSMTTASEASYGSANGHGSPLAGCGSPTSPAPRPQPVEVDVLIAPGTSKESVPLAEMERLSESVGVSSDEGVHWPSYEDMDGAAVSTTAEDADSSSPANESSSSGGIGACKNKQTTRKRKWKSKKHGAKNKVLNGPVVAPASVSHVVDMNGNGTTSKYRRWLSRIESYDDLERTFAGISEDGLDDEDDDARTPHLMADFVGKYYNTHHNGSGYSNALTKTVNIVRRKSLSDSASVEDLLKFTKNSSIPTSHIHLLDTEDVALACSIFKDLYKYVRGELKGDIGHSVVRSVLAHGYERIALRDEIYAQLVRLTNANPSPEGATRAWGIMCLCTVAFSPSRTLAKYLMTYLRQHCDPPSDDLTDDPSTTLRVSRYAEYCLQHLRNLQDRPRKKIASTVEIEAVLQLEPLVLRIYFLDGSMKSIAFDPTTNTKDALGVIAEKIGLQDPTGWALYESTPTHDRYIRLYEYLADILADWEEKQRPHHHHHHGSHHHGGHHSNPSTPKKGSPHAHVQTYGKLVMCKRLFQRVSELTEDPTELHLLYIQAMHYVVHLDEYLVPANISLHLAGLQAQIEYGDYDESKRYRYQEEDSYLSQRVLCSDTHRNWMSDIAHAHKRFGRGKSAVEAERRYLTIVSQFQLYGCTKIFAHYRGVWPYGIETILAVNYDGIKCISLQEKTLVFDYYYADLEQILLEERYEECHIIITLKNCVSQSKQKCYMFECLGLEDFASLIEFYSPAHATWIQNSRSWQRIKFKPTNDWLKLYDDILLCRRTLLHNNVMNKPSTSSGGILKAALNKLSGRNCAASSSSSGSSSGHNQADGDVSDDAAISAFWSFSRTPFKSALTKCSTHEIEDVSARMFNSTLVYTGLESAAQNSLTSAPDIKVKVKVEKVIYQCLRLPPLEEVQVYSPAVLEDMDLVVVVQTLIKKCMDNENLCNEFYLQLIKQTTDTQTEPNQKAIIRYWHLMTMATCVMLPPNEVVFNYLNLHLRRYAMQQTNEEGQFAYFCIKTLYRTYENKERHNPPSFKEIHFVTKREPIEARVYLTDGHAMLIEFDSSTTALELIRIIKAKAGMRLDAEHYGVYHTLGEKEFYIKPEEKLADALYNWERSCRNENPANKDLILTFKKRLFIEPFVNLNDPLEVDLLYNQSVTDVFEQKIPLTKADATALCALRAQFEYGDYGQANSFDYSAVMRILPRHLRDLLMVEEILLLHRSYKGMSHIDANIAFLKILKHWPLYGATMFEVTQTNLDTLPRCLWLAVSQMGLHLMEIRGPDIYFTYAFDEITSTNSTSKNLSIIVGKEGEGPGFLFYTAEGDQITRLLQDYRESLRDRRKAPPLRDITQTTIEESPDSVNIDSLTLDLSS